MAILIHVVAQQDQRGSAIPGGGWRLLLLRNDAEEVDASPAGPQLPQGRPFRAASLSLHPAAKSRPAGAIPARRAPGHQWRRTDQGAGAPRSSVRGGWPAAAHTSRPPCATSHAGAHLRRALAPECSSPGAPAPASSPHRTFRRKCIEPQYGQPAASLEVLAQTPGSRPVRRTRAVTARCGNRRCDGR